MTRRKDDWCKQKKIQTTKGKVQTKATKSSVWLWWGLIFIQYLNIFMFGFVSSLVRSLYIAGGAVDFFCVCFTSKWKGVFPLFNLFSFSHNDCMRGLPTIWEMLQWSPAVPPHVNTSAPVYWQKPTFSTGTDWSWSPWSALSWYCCSLRCCWKVLRDLSPRSAGGNTANPGSRPPSSRRASSTSSSFGFSVCLGWGAGRPPASKPWCRSTWWIFTACTLQTETTALNDPRAWGNTPREPPARPTRLEAFTTKVCISDIPLPVSQRAPRSSQTTQTYI